MRDQRKDAIRRVVRLEALADVREHLLAAWTVASTQRGLAPLADPVEGALDRVEDALRRTRDEADGDADRLPERAVEAAADWRGEP